MIYNSDQIKQILPHRYPFLLVDAVLEKTSLEKIKAIKNVTVNEPFFQGHFPEKHVMPGVLIIEALAQTGAILLLSHEKYQGKLAYFAGIDKCRFKRQVVPGDQLVLTVEVLKLKGPVGKGKAVASVNGELAATAEIMFAIEL